MIAPSFARRSYLVRLQLNWGVRPLPLHFYIRRFSVPRTRRQQRIRCAAIVAAIFALPFASPDRADAQAARACTTDRTVSTLVGAGLGAAAGAIPATIVHRRDQTSSHRIVAVSISAGALIGFVAAGRDHPCITQIDSPAAGGAVIAGRSSHARRGAIAGALTGTVLGAVGGTFYNIGCKDGPCNETRTRIEFMSFSAAEGAVAFGLLGSLIGWAWPMTRH